MNNQKAKTKKASKIQIQELFTPEYIEKLIETDQNPLRKFRLNQKETSKVEQFRYQSQVQRLFSLTFPERTAKIIKNLKHFMHDLECFSVQKNSNIIFGNLESNASFHQDQQILKRDIDSLTTIFAMYSSVAYYSKGQIIEASGWKKQKIQILLKGRVGIYEPTNKKSLQNCIKKNKDQQDENNTPHFLLFNNKATKTQNKSEQPINFLKIQTDENNRTSSPSRRENQRWMMIESLVNGILGVENKESLTNENCQQILTLCQIMTPLTPHKFSKVIERQGELLVAASKQNKILSQSLDAESGFSAICLSEQAILVELENVIFRQILWLVNNDEQKLYITSLMRKFESLKYFQAQRYLKKKQNIIDYLSAKHKSPSKTHNQSPKPRQSEQEQSENSNEDDQQGLIQSPTQQKMTLQERKESLQLNKAQSLQTESSSLYFTLPYNATPYLIVQGEVIIVINKVKQQKLIDQKYSIPRKTYIRHELLKIYQNDIFGVESIGSEPQFSLRYEIRKDSKILKMNKNILKQQIKTIPNFQFEFKEFKFKRDQILRQILDKLSKQIQKQLVNKYAQPHNFNGGQKISQNVLKQIVHQQKEDKHLEVKQNVLNETETTQKKDHLNRNNLSLPTIKNYQTKSFGNQSERDSEKMSTFSLTERKKQSEKSSHVQKINDVEYVGSKDYSELKKQLLEKLSLKEKKRYSAQNQKRLTVELLKQFNLVKFSENQPSLGPVNQAFVQMRDPVSGVLLRRRSVPSVLHIEGSKNRKKIEKAIMRKIGLLTEGEKVKHNQKVVKSRKSEVGYENLEQIRRKQQKRLIQLSKSVPKLQNFYSKQADILYKNRGSKKL